MEKMGKNGGVSVVWWGWVAMVERRCMDYSSGEGCGEERVAIVESSFDAYSIHTAMTIKWRLEKSVR